MRRMRKLLAECHGRFGIALNLQFDRLAAGKWLPPPPPPAPPIQSQAQARHSNNTQHPPSPDWDAHQYPGFRQGGIPGPILETRTRTRTTRT